MRVAIIGCGPAGLFAAEACAQQGAAFNILAPRKSMSPIGGAQYLHREIPTLSELKPHPVEYRKIGTRDGYAMKVYGNMAMDVSWDTFDEGVKPAWSLQTAYGRAWLRYSDRIKEAKVTPRDIKALCSSYDLVISTAPKKSLCLRPDEHDFTSQKVYVVTRGMDGAGEDRIVYNGQPNVEWYRWSYLRGQSSYEFSQMPRYNKKIMVEVHKPLLHFCRCHPQDNYLEVGRYGRWKKGALTHEAYFMTMDALDAL